MSPEAKENFKEAAFSNLKSAQEALIKGLFPDAYNRSFWSGENALKRVLEKAGQYVSRPPPHGDRRHEGWQLWLKIRDKKIITHDIPKIEKIVYHLFDINLSNGVEHVDCAPTGTDQLGKQRYVDQSRFINEKDAKEKVELAEQLLVLLNSDM
jgi:HEPN domain-containing protein